MLFNSWQYAVFLPLVAAAYFLVPHRVRWVLLLGASYYFYMSWNPNLVFLILFTTASSYTAALGVEHSRSERARRAWLAGGVCLSLACLFFFKYFNFFSESVTALLRAVSLPVGDFTLNVILPVGISFYTFQTLSYVIDVYRGQMKAERHFGIYALYVSFFPQLVAGPIERAVTLLPQFREEHRPDASAFSYGCHQIAWGLFKKVVVADTAAVYVDKVYGDLSMCAPMGYVIATLLFAFQVYCDFSGYSDIALGSAHILGFRLMRNFRCPYFARSIKDFWRRWHISLSTWFQDYVYIPLGGSRCGRARHLRNLFLTFLVSGLWHGAKWTFVAWGALFGVLSMADVLVIPRLDRFERSRGKIGRRAVQLLRWAVCFGLVCVCWVFFRAETMSDALYIISRLPYALWMPVQNLVAALGTIGLTGGALWGMLAALAALTVYDAVETFYGDPIALLQRQAAPVRWGVRYAVCLAVLLVALTRPEGTKAEFIYFQF